MQGYGALNMAGNSKILGALILFFNSQLESQQSFLDPSLRLRMSDVPSYGENKLSGIGISYGYNKYRRYYVKTFLDFPSCSISSCSFGRVLKMGCFQKVLLLFTRRASGCYEDGVSANTSSTGNLFHIR